MKKTINTTSIFALLLLAANNLFSQANITGPTCVTAGVVYEYTITGNWDSTSTMQVCINGGAIYDAADSNECTPTGPPIARVLVDWDTTGVWSLTVTSTDGNKVLQVSAIIPLTPGSIDSASKVQMIAHDSVPAAITCSADVGGSCNPTYSYQWQQSADLASWTDIAGATGASLTFTETLQQSSFFRRKVTETVSGTISASTAAAVYIVSPANNDSSQTTKDSSSTGFNIYRAVSNKRQSNLFSGRPLLNIDWQDSKTLVFADLRQIATMPALSKQKSTSSKNTSTCI